MGEAGNSNSSGTSISKHELLSNYIALADLMNKQYESRRALAWKIHVAVWTLLVVCGYAFLKFKLCLNMFCIPPQYVLLSCLGLFCLFYLFFCILIQRGEKIEQGLSIQYREKADGILQFKKKEKKKSFGPRWILLQCLTTLFLAFMVFIIGYNNCRTPQFSDVTIEKKIGDLNQEYDYKKAYQECLEKDLKNLKQLLEKLESQVKNSNKNRVTS